MSDTGTVPVAGKSLLGRAVGVIVSPGETFADVARAPRPVGILLIVCLTLGLSTGLPQLTERGRQATLDMQVRQMERLTGNTVSPEAYAQLERTAQYTAYAAIASPFLFIPVISLLFAALYWAVFNALLGGLASFKQVLAVVTHSHVIAALGTLAAAPIQHIQGIQSVAGPFTLGALAPMLEPDSRVASFLGAIGFFTLWQLVVSAIGLGTLYRRRTAGIAVALIVAYLCLVAAFTTVLSSFAGR